jgi:hypothetical protein
MQVPYGADRDRPPREGRQGAEWPGERDISFVCGPIRHRDSAVLEGNTGVSQCVSERLRPTLHIEVAEDYGSGHWRSVARIVDAGQDRRMCSLLTATAGGRFEPKKVALTRWGEAT